MSLSWGLCPRRFLSDGGGLCPGGLCPGVSLSMGQGNAVCQGDPSDRDPHMVTSGRHASYWNAFLFLKFLEDKSPFGGVTDTPVLDL